ncbi:unnamed protein product [Microthlaspi erraticum]|uniref:Uncharacterized protein n=1 Tax=Microthlaspi erraticum TaxID=1685480 RepID=A0A6D2JP31_9BRAS|nr:unnamed protein product [Microthlaspi erraticum]
MAMKLNLSTDFIESFRGKIVQYATDPERVPKLLFLVDLADADEMKVVAKECVQGIKVLMNHPIGVRILKRVSLHMKMENAEFLEKLVENISNLLLKKLGEIAPPQLLCSFISQMEIETLMEFACNKCKYTNCAMNVN